MRPVFVAAVTIGAVMDYPTLCQQRFLAKCGELRAARYHADMKRIRKDLDLILDDFLLWRDCFSA